LPTTVRLPLDDGGEVVLVHGSPSDPTEPITHDMSDEEISALLGDDPADVVVCGGSHVPFDRTVSGVRIINVGSVGEAPSGAPRSSAGPQGHTPFLHADATFLEVGRRRKRGDAGTQGTQGKDAWTAEDIAVERLVVPLGKAA
jgi:hypothetical protein